ncbi:MAG: hypothetical protein KIS86_02625 [Devosia sp.]|nr:hypothetical protein [Devosia sp.]
MATEPSTIGTAAEWLATNWESAVIGAALTAQLRERFGLEFSEAVKAIAEAKRLRGGK